MDDELNGESDKQGDIKLDGGARNFKPWLWRKGQSGNPAGRPKGKSMKEWTREYLASMTQEEREDFLDGIPKDILWRMSEGQPHQSTDMEVKASLQIVFDDSFKEVKEDGDVEKPDQL